MIMIMYTYFGTFEVQYHIRSILELANHNQRKLDIDWLDIDVL